MGKRIVIMGYMGSGKSTIAQNLSKLTAKKMVDLDNFIEENEGQTISQIFKTKGEIYFRKIERVYLKRLLDDTSIVILSLGGGTPCYGDHLELIKNTENLVTVYLSASIKKLTERLFRETQIRPLISHLKTKEKLEDFIRKHLFERGFYYNQADIVVQTDSKTIEEVVEEIKKALF